MRIKQIYQQFEIPPNLQEHMLRVAALSEIITSNWTGVAIDKVAITQACLLHDIAKPMKFNLSKQAEFGMSEADIARLAALQDRLKTNYRENEHEAAVKITKEVGCKSEAVMLVDNLEWEYIPRLLACNDLQSLIPIYCDMRIAPRGIMPLTDRLNELKNRDHDSDSIDDLMKAGLELEKVLQNYVTIDLNQITDDQITSKLEQYD